MHMTDLDVEEVELLAIPNMNIYCVDQVVHSHRLQGRIKEMFYSSMHRMTVKPTDDERPERYIILTAV